MPENAGRIARMNKEAADDIATDTIHDESKNWSLPIDLLIKSQRETIDRLTRENAVLNQNIAALREELAGVIKGDR